VLYAKDLLAESANMILGNSIKAYPDIEELIIIGTPSVLHSLKGDISYRSNQMYGYEIVTDKGALVIAIIQ
jgi:two-component system chemotaxis sensor kinase CheA